MSDISLHLFLDKASLIKVSKLGGHTLSQHFIRKTAETSLTY
jgi:hypothetical protein